MPISKAVIAFPNDEHPGDAPIVPLVVAIDRDGIHRTLFPAERRRALNRSSSRHTDRAAGQRISVMQMRVEAEVRFQAVNYRKEVPGHRHPLCDALIPGTIAQDTPD